MRDVIVLTGTVGSGGTVSNELATLYSTSDTLANYDIIGVEVPAAFTGTALGFQMSRDGTNYWPVMDTSGGTSVKAAGSSYTAISPLAYPSLPHAKIFTGSAQAAARTFYVLARKGD